MHAPLQSSERAEPRAVVVLLAHSVNNSRQGCGGMRACHYLLHAFHFVRIHFVYDRVALAFL